MPSDLEKAHLETADTGPVNPEAAPEEKPTPEAITPTPEQQDKIEKNLSVLEKLGGVWEKKGELLKIAEPVKSFGKYLNEHPKTRLGIGLGFGAMAIATGGATLLASGAWRAASSVGTFVAIEEWLRRDYEKATGEERTKTRAVFHTGAALAIAVFFGSGLASQTAQNVFGLFGGEEIKTIKDGVRQSVSGIIGGEQTTEAAQTVAPEAAALPEYAVEKGDNLYKILRANFSGIGELDGGKQTNAIENILKEIRKNPAEYGISSGDADSLATGDKINIQKIAEILSEKKIGGEGIMEHAQNLSEETVKNIESYVPPPQELGELEEIPPETEPTPQHIRENWADITPEKLEQMKQEYDAPGNATLEEISQMNAISHFENPEAVANMASIDPADKETLNIARESFYRNLDDLYGESSWFGFSKIAGVNSEAWQMLKNQSVVSIMDVENAEGNVAKLQGWMENLIRDANIRPEGLETADNFVKRALFAVSKTGAV